MSLDQPNGPFTIDKFDSREEQQTIIMLHCAGGQVDRSIVVQGQRIYILRFGDAWKVFHGLEALGVAAWAADSAQNHESDCIQSRRSAA